MIDRIAKVIKVLNSETDPWQISLAVCLAMVAGFSPAQAPHNLLVLLALLVFRVNLSTFLLAWPLFSALAFALDPLFDAAGRALLTSKSLLGLWTTLYNTTWFRLDRLYNTVVMGSLAVALLLFVPVFVAGNFVVARYRKDIRQWVGKWKLAQAIKASKIFEVYQRLSQMGGGV